MDATMALWNIEEVELPAWQPVTEVLGGAGVQEIPLPDGMGFGGADVWSGVSKDGTLYSVLCVERPGLKFGTYAFRLLPDGRREWISLQEFTEGRVTVSPERGVQILTWLSPNSRAVRRAQLPGYVSPEAAGVATPIQIVPTAPASGSGGGADQDARKGIADLKKQVSTLAKRADELAARPAAAPLSGGQLADALWSVLAGGKGEDWLYGLLGSNQGGVVGQIQRLAAETVRAMKQRGEL